MSVDDQRGRVLLVDDEESILQTLGDVLRDAGHEILESRDGERALALIQTESPDVILLDVWMPGLDGIETLKRFKEQLPDVPVIMVTGHGNVETAVRATKLGAFDFFEKPVSAPAILSSVQHALVQRRLLLENRRLRLSQVGPHSLQGDSEAMNRLRSRIAEYQERDEDVILVGEAGVGKRLTARLLHLGSKRKDGPFVVLTTADRERSETISLLAERRAELWRRGARGSVFVDGAHRIDGSLVDAVCRTTGRPRLYLGCEPPGPEEGQGRLRIEIPPLRDRKEDIPELARAFLWQYCDQHSKPEMALTEEAERALSAYSWPSNVGEIKNVIERVVLTAPERAVRVEDLPREILRETRTEEAEMTYVEAVQVWERRFLETAFEREGGDLARLKDKLGLETNELERKLRDCGLLREALPPFALRQRTIGKSVVLGGQGLHSGVKTGLILNPLPPGSGILFGGVNHDQTVPARLEFVDRTGYATGLRRGQAVASTIEHLLATLHAYGITNLLVKVIEEVPIMDGSAVEFCNLLEEGGIEEQDAAIEEILVGEPIQMGDPEDPEGEWLCLEPSDGFEVTYDLQYPPPVGRQVFHFRLSGPDSFRREVAPARTFGFLKDIEKLQGMGLASGGHLSNFILIDDEKIVNTELRFPNEFARHKVLDILGDFYLLGRPIRGHVRARKTGHADNVALLRHLETTIASRLEDPQ